MAIAPDAQGRRVRLHALKPRVATLKTQRVATLNHTPQSPSWRYDKTSSTQRGYGYAWQQARARFLQQHPLCVTCEAQDLTVPATVVDHRIPHRGDQKLFWDESNWQAMCKPHHDAKTQAETAAGL
jgi:5-methylcytosine-specific restriction protein A